MDREDTTLNIDLYKSMKWIEKLQSLAQQCAVGIFICTSLEDKVDIKVTKTLTAMHSGNVDLYKSMKWIEKLEHSVSQQECWIIE